VLFFALRIISLRGAKGGGESRAGKKMLEGKAMVEDTDMPLKMQAQAMAAASRALDRFDISDCRNIAAHIKKVIKPSIHPSICSRS
jgi:hypothetical protein